MNPRFLPEREAPRFRGDEMDVMPRARHLPQQSLGINGAGCAREGDDEAFGHEDRVSNAKTLRSLRRF